MVRNGGSNGRVEFDCGVFAEAFQCSGYKEVEGDPVLPRDSPHSGPSLPGTADEE